MKYKPFIPALLYSFFFLTGSIYGVGEKTITLGSAASWELMEKRQGIAEVLNVRPHPVLVLSGRLAGGTNYGSNEGFDKDSLDLHLSFDEGRPTWFADTQGNYNVFVSPELGSVADSWSRFGKGAAVFNGKTGGSGYEGPLVLKPRPSALFAPGSHVRDFSMEFWLFPKNLENGEQILSWHSSKPDGKGGYISQRIQCLALGDKLQWTFGNFFFSPGGKNSKPISLSGSILINRTWSHHLIRYDADLGLLEYLVDGRLEALVYTTSSEREGGDVYTPAIGEDCRLILGGRFSGMMDEFRIFGACLQKPVLSRYSGSSGRVETRTMDLGYSYSSVLKIEAFGGRTSNSAGTLRSEYAGNSTLRFPDHAELVFFIRLNSSPYRWNEIPWIPFVPGTELLELRGRYVQLAVDFYPSGEGETSPYLSELKVTYKAAEPPPPPSLVTATVKDGAVELSWRASPSRDVGGYLIYYGTAKGEYFEIKSPIDAGSRTSFLIDGLKNGTLYYFAVAAYGMPINRDYYFVPEPGNFSREVAARPLRMAE
jgi:hypothetical protein